MKFDLQQAAAALGALYLGQQQGKQLAEQRELREGEAALDHFRLLAGMEEAERDQELEQARFTASLPGQTPESQQAAVQNLLRVQQGQAGTPRQYGHDAYARIARQMFGDRFPQMPQAPMARQPVEPAPAFTPQFQSPGEDQARQTVLDSLRGIGKQAEADGDDAGAQRIRDLMVMVARGKMTPEQASAEAGKVETVGRQSADARKRAEAPFTELVRRYETGAFKPEFRGKLGALVQRYQGLPLYGKERAAALQALTPALAELGTDWHDLDPAAKLNLENAKTQGDIRLRNEYQGLLKNAAGAKNPAQAHVFLQQAFQLAQTPEGRKAGISVPEAFDPTPRVIPGGGFEEVGFDLPDRTETAAEVRARQQAALAEFIEDPKEQQQALQKAADAIWNTIKSGHVKSGSVENLLDQLNGIYGKLGVPVVVPKDAWEALTPIQKEQVKARNDQARMARQRFGLDQQKFKLDQERDRREAAAHNERMKSGYYKRHGNEEGNVTERDRARLTELQARRRAAEAIVEDYNKAQSDPFALVTPEMKAAADRAEAEVGRINKAIEGITGEVLPTEKENVRGSILGDVVRETAKPKKGYDPKRERAIFVATLIRDGKKTRQEAEREANRIQWR